MATLYTGAQTTSAVSTTGTLKRTVTPGDKVRHLFPMNASVIALAMVKSGAAELKIKQGKNMIGKKRVETPKFEAFTYTPIAISFTVTSCADLDNLVLTSVSGLRPTYTLVNTSNHTVCRVGTVTTATLTLAVTTIGSTTFSASANDTLLCLAPAYPENSSSPYILQKDEDNLWNTVQISRFPCAVSKTAAGNPHFGGDFWQRIKTRTTLEALRRLENNLIWQERGTAETGTSDANLSDTFRTTRGLWNWAQTEIDFGGNLSLDRFQNKLGTELHESVDTSKDLIMFTSKQVSAKLMSEIQQYNRINQQSDLLKKIGIKGNVYETAGNTVHVIVHDSFNRGSNTGKALVYDPEQLFYAVLRDRDFKVQKNIQSNSTDGFEDEMICEAGFGVIDGGYGIAKVINLL